MASATAAESGVLSDVETILKAPEAFIIPDATLASSIASKVKRLYDSVKARETAQQSSSDALPELIVDGFDDEQVWQELELQNGHIVDRLVAEASRCVGKSSKGFGTVAADDGSGSNSGCGGGGVPDGTAALEDVDDGSSGSDDVESADARTYEDDDSDEAAAAVDLKESDNVKPSSVDDQFFKLSEMEKFLEQEDARFEREQQRKAEPSDDSEEEQEDDENEEEEASYMYSDFFESSTKTSSKTTKKAVHWEEADDGNDMGSVASSEESLEAALNSREELMKKVDLLSESEEEGDGSEDGDDQTEEKPSESKSSFEKRMEKQKKIISELEESNVADKPWQLRGEVSANQRPENSLLEVAVDYDVTSAPAPLVTQETTLKLEDLIIQRIKDKAFDDVERKEKNVKEVAEYKKRIVLDQEKSKQSLSQVYEQEYLKKVASQAGEEEAKEDPKHAEIKKMMTALFAKLDALSNFNFTPRPAMPEIKIVSNMPALTMEEATPVTASEANSLAPEEIRKPVAHLQSKAERTTTDKKRERRRKKALGHAKRLERLAEEDRKLAAAASASTSGEPASKAQAASVSKLEHKRALAALSKAEKTDGNVTVLKDKNAAASDKAYRSSAQFFQRLQEQAAVQVKLKRPAQLSKSAEKQSVKKLKL